jgi:hypothetical protein
LIKINSGSVLLPESQRGYVQNRDRVRGLKVCSPARVTRRFWYSTRLVLDPEKADLARFKELGHEVFISLERSATTFVQESRSHGVAGEKARL